jgi:AcrR family transcriptional regulator
LFISESCQYERMNEASAQTRGERRRAQTRTRLEEAGRRLITEKGVAALRISEITEDADVALGSFYNHFASKEDLVEAVVSTSLQELASALAGTDEGQDPAVVTSIATRRVVRLAFDDPAFARLVVNLNHADALFAKAFSPVAAIIVERGLKAGRFHAIAVNLVVGSSLSLIRAILDGEHADGVEIVHTELALRGLGVPAAEAQSISRLPLPPS